MAKPRTAGDYEEDVTAASRVGLAEIMTVLGAYRESLVLIGGWAPYLILEQFGEPGQEQFDATQEFDAEVTFGRFVHVGSIDIDFVVDPAVIDADRYATIVESLLDRDYEPVKDSLYQFEKVIPSPRSGQKYPIRIDFLTPRLLAGQGRSHRHREVQHNLRARTLEGAEIALAHCPKRVSSRSAFAHDASQPIVGYSPSSPSVLRLRRSCQSGSSPRTAPGFAKCV